MTDKRLTCAQVNEEVAEILGWDKIIDKDGPGWLCPGGCIYCAGSDTPHNHPPDSCGEWQHAGPLWEKLLRKYREITIHDGLTFVNILAHKTQLCWLSKDENSDKNDYVPEAITRAFHAWKKGEK